MTADTTDPTIHKTVHVDVPVERAFDVFTRGWPDWWPFATHSVDQGRAEIDWRVGGVVAEIVGDDRHEWAVIVEFEPPHRFAMRWRVNPEKPPTDLRVTFEPAGDGTRVELTHSGWEAYDEAAEESFTDYNGGWDKVLGHYVRFVGGA
jgi:uncharacterized protein YndB with AHSA1/START domain